MAAIEPLDLHRLGDGNLEQPRDLGAEELHHSSGEEASEGFLREHHQSLLPRGHPPSELCDIGFDDLPGRLHEREREREKREKRGRENE